MIHFFHKYKAILLIPLFYVFLSKIFHTLLLTITTSSVLIAGDTNQDLSTVVNEIASQYIIASYALAAFLAALTIWLGDKALYTHTYYWTSEQKKIWQLERNNRREFYRGLSSGSIAAIILASILLLTNQISFLGLYITSALSSPVFPIFIINFLSVIILLASEEFLFRHKLLTLLNSNSSNTVAILLCSAFYIIIKFFQFSLTTLDIINLFLLNLMLCFFYLKNKKAHRGLAFLLAFICLLHPIAGLPLWEQTNPSFFLMKHTAKSSILMTGGAEGPMASLSITSIFALLCLASYYSWKREQE